jgi:glycosyltransferase involved in cell wall biosynthesis
LSLHLEYLARGIDSWLAVGNNNWGGPQAIQIPNDARRSRRARALLRPAWAVASRSKRPSDAAGVASRGLRILAEPERYLRVMRGFEDFDFPETPYIADLPPRAPDVLHLHSLHGSYFDIRQLPALSAARPTIVTMHDCWLLTGHCAYPLDCEHWKTGCGQCPYLDIYVPIRHDESAENYRVKRDALAASRLGLATPSRWLMRMAEEAGVVGDNTRPRVIPNGVDTAVFRLADKAEARAKLGLPGDRRIVLFSGRALSESAYKGFAAFADAVRIVAARPDGEDVLFLALGSDAPSTRLGRAELRHVPFTADTAEVARYYQAADLYVHPARAENLPLAILEAMACGAPVVASDVGGIPEIIEDGRSGLLAKPDDAVALADAIVGLLGDDARREAFSAAASRRVTERFTLEQQADAYLDWYRELHEQGL